MNGGSQAAGPGSTDLVTTAVIRGYLEATCREMGLALTRNAISPIFIEGQDFSCAVLDADRELVAAANYDPSHLCSMPYSVDWAVLELGVGGIDEGDVVIVNDAYRGGTHLPDVTMFSPIVLDGRLIAYAVTRAHQLDIGGMTPGSIPGGARDCFAEGLRIPPLKWNRAGEENRDVVETILTNVRLPDVQLSDLRAQVASLLTCRDRLEALSHRYGIDTVVTTMRAIKDQSEALMRAFVASIADGSYTFTDYMDGDGNTGYRYAIQVRVDVEGGEVTVDFTGTSAQAEGAINLPFAMTASSVFNAFLQLAGTAIPFNHGCFRPIHFVAPRNSLVNAQPPGPTFGCTTDTPLRVIDAITGALAPALPDRVIAGSYGTCNCVAGSGENADGEPFLFWFFYEGGWGASRSRDGWNATPNQSANFRDYPVEVLESSYPLRCDTVGLVPNSGGAGRHRGGLGTVHQFTFLRRTVLSGFGDRHEIGPYGLNGGSPGQPNRFLFRRSGDGSWSGIEAFTGNPSKFSSFVAEAGDSLMIVTGGGGGYGEPSKRPISDLRNDVEEEVVTDDAAKREYSSGDRAFESPGGNDDVPSSSGDSRPLHAFSPKNLLGEVRPPPESEDFASRARELLAQVRKGFCHSTCPLQADPLRCPYYHPDALEFWPVHALRRWTELYCPISDRLKELFDG